MAATLADTRSPALVALARSLDHVADQIASGSVLDWSVPERQDGDELAEIVAAADRLVAAVRRSHALEAAVHELFEAMSSHLRLDYLSCEALYRLIDHTQARGGAIVLVGEGPGDVVASVDFELDGEQLAAVMASVPSGLGPMELPAPDDAAASIVAVPFADDSGLLGAVLLLGVQLDREVCRMLALLARALGFAVSNALAHAVAETHAATDPLTGCSNRRAGLEALEQSARVAAHGGPAVGAMMIDLDHFKQINDRYGHQIGDDVLRAVGVSIASGLRDRDNVTRYGGEEFLVTIAGADATVLSALAERVSQQIRDLEVADGTGGTIALTTSVGVATWSASDTVESLIARADRALYAAKESGRDRVVIG